MTKASEGAALRVAAPAADLDRLALTVETRPPPLAGPGECLVEIAAAGVNPSDVAACLGRMPQAVWPRTPGRDWAGTVIAGPAELIGRAVYGSSGRLGIERDGSHARFLGLPASHLSPKPAALSFEEAAGLGVPFVTAWQGLEAAGGVKPGEVVLVLGANGKVGQAAVQLAAWRGGRVFAVSRAAGYIGDSAAPVAAIDGREPDVAGVVRAATRGHGADIVYNTIGSPYFDTACAAMAEGARQILIATIERNVPFDIFRFYRGRHVFLGIDSLAADGAECARILDRLNPLFSAGSLRPFPVPAECRLPLAAARSAYLAVMAREGGRNRLVLIP
jgi:NADPH2:quinone reductase